MELAPTVASMPWAWKAHGATLDAWYDRIKQSVYLTTDRLHVLRQVMQVCRKGGWLSIPGVYGGFLDKVPFGAAFGKGLNIAMGQTHVNRYLTRMIEQIEKGFDPAHIVSHRGSLDDAPRFYELFHKRADGCTKVVLTP